MERGYNVLFVNINEFECCLLCGLLGGKTSVPHKTPSVLHTEWRTSYRASGKGWRQDEGPLQDTHGTNV